MITSKRDIPKPYQALFMDVLGEINDYFPLDLKTISREIGILKFPRSGQSAMFLAVTDSDSHSFMPFQPVVVLDAAPHHVSKTTSVLEFKLFDTRSTANRIITRVSLTVFPSGRQILKAYGLQLDTAGKSRYQPLTMAVDKMDFSRSPALLKLVRTLIEHFPTNTDEGNNSKQECLKDLDSPTIVTGQG